MKARKEIVVSQGHCGPSAKSMGRSYAGIGYEPTRFARKHGITRQQARDIIRKIGSDRAKLNEAAERLKRELTSSNAPTPERLMR
jgi:hypothetical protein